MKRRILSLLSVLLLVSTCSGCSFYERWKTESLTMVVTAETIEQLEDYPNLVSADLSGSTCYEAIEDYMLRHPEVSVTYTIQVLDQFYPLDTTQLNLSQMTPDDLPQVLEALERLPEVTSIDLMSADGSPQLELAHVKQLMEAYPALTLNYAFSFFGQTVDLYQERLEYIEVEMGDEAEPQLRELLSVLPNLNYIKLDRCGFSSEVLDGVKQDFPQTKVVWRVFYGTKFSALTDETVIRSSHYLRNDNISEMKYLTDVVYMDIGHNETLTDVSFINYMPNLKLLILSGSPIQDISPLANHTELEFAELCFCGNLSDLSPLQSCTGLKFLNIAGTNARDLSPIMELPLERFVCMLTRIPTQDKNAFVEAHPDCLSVLTGKQPYGYGWRYIDDGYNFNDYYKTMREIFHYDEEALLNGYAWDEATKNDPW